MRISRTGRVLAGVAGTVSSIDNVIIPQTQPGNCCGGWEWLDDNLAAGQVCGNALDGACSMIDETGRVLVAEGAFNFAAGRGRWASRLTTLRSNFITDPGSAEFADCIPLNGSHDGDIALCMGYQRGADIRVYRADGGVVDVLGGLVYMFARVRNGLLTFANSGAGWRVVDIRTGREVPFVRRDDVDYMVAVRSSVGIVLMERTTPDANIRLRRADSSEGRIVGVYGGPGRETYFPDCVALDGGNIKAAWAFTQRENPGEWEAATVAASSLPGPSGIMSTPSTPLDIRVTGNGGAASLVGVRDDETILLVGAAALAAFFFWRNH
jgi:hypothetical protein